MVAGWDKGTEFPASKVARTASFLASPLARIFSRRIILKMKMKIPMKLTASANKNNQVIIGLLFNA